MRTFWVSLAVVAAVSLIGFFIVDAVRGENSFAKGVIVGHHYVPPQTSCWTDSDGVMHWSTSPEEFHLICESPERTFDVNCGRQQYYSITNNQQILVKTRVGRYSGAHYAPRIIPGLEK